MLLICRSMFDIGDTYLVETYKMRLYRNTCAHYNLKIKQLAPGIYNSTRNYDGTYQYLVSQCDKTFEIKEIYKWMNLNTYIQ